MSSQPVALVTGGSRGIGRAIATNLAADHQVVATYRGRRDAAESLAEETGSDFHQLDIGDAASRDRLMDWLEEKYGRLNLLVNNAGIAPRERKDILEASEGSFEEVVNTNLRGPYFLTQRAARLMVEQKAGRIVFVTSISAYTSSTNRGEYCVSKAGLSMTVQLYADRLASDGIGVFEIRPGIILTDMVEPVREKYEKLAADGLLPQGRLGQPEDIAKTVRAIADGNLDYSTGQVLESSGGFHLRRL